MVASASGRASGSFDLDGQADCVLGLLGMGVQGIDLALWRRGALPAAQAVVYWAGGGVFLRGFSVVCARLFLV